MTLQTGDVLGPYRIGERLGAGAMGEVYQALDQRLGREVAIKALPDALVGNEERVARFHREARALAALNHPGIATLYSFDELDGRFYLVMELVPGKTLRELLEQPLPVGEAVDLGIQLADALAVAHEGGIIHRDLKPENIKVTPAGRLKILDFGLMKRFGLASEPPAPSAASLTAAGVAVGTLNYMSPEQLNGARADARIDVWAFGCVLFEMLAGSRAFGGVEGEPWSPVLAILHREPEWERLPTDLPAKVEKLLRQCLEKDPRLRLRDLGAARSELEQASSATPAAATSELASSTQTEVPRHTASTAPTMAFAAESVPDAEVTRPVSATPRQRSSVRSGSSATLRERERGITAAFGVLGLLLMMWGVQLYFEQRLMSQRIGITSKTTERHRAEIEGVDPGSPAARGGVEAGDVIVSVDGQPTADWDSYNRITWKARGNAPWTVVLRRGGRLLTVVVHPGFPIRWFEMVRGVAVALLYWLVGVLALWRAPSFFRARMLFLYCVLIAVEFLTPAIPLRWGPATDVFLYLLNGLQAAVELHLVLLIPRAPDLLRRHPRWPGPLYLVCIGSGMVAALTSIAEASGWSWPWSVETIDFAFLTIGFAAWATAEVCWLVYRAATFPQRFGRGQAGLVLAGSLPWAVLAWLGLVFGTRGIEEPAWMAAADPWALLVWPLAVLGAIERETRRRRALALAVVSQSDRTGNEADLVRQLGQQIERTFGMDRAAIFVRDDGLHALRSFYGDAESAPSLSVGATLLQVLEGAPAEYEIGHLLQQPLPPSEKAWLQALDVQLLVPATTSDGEVVGLLLLGDKPSGEPYTPTDRAVLLGIARQLAWVHDNQRLRLRAEEQRRVEHEVLGPLRRRQLELVRTCPSCGRCFAGDQQRCDRDLGELSLALPVERVVEGRYRLDRVIGHGAMGLVFEALDESLKRSVAVKVLTGRMFGDAVALKRFEREARVAARLHHPNVVSVHDYGVLDTGGAFLVMELLGGETLERVLAGGHRVPPATLADWLEQACEGLQAAHGVRVLHRDLKPANLFVARLNSGRSLIKLLDFGLAKLRAETAGATASLTAPGAVIGTIAYMAPEQLRGEEADERSDIYSLGMIALEALTGRRPFGERSGPALYAAILGEEYALPGPWSANERLKQAVERCLAKNPAERFGSVQELREQLVAAILTAA